MGKSIIQQNSKLLLSIRLSSFPNFCLVRPLIFSTFLFESHEKKTESLSFNLQSFASSFIEFSEKNLAIGPFPINFSLSFSNVMYPNPLAPSSLAQLLKLSKKLLGFEEVFGAGIALTIEPSAINFLKISNLTSSLFIIVVTSNICMGFLKSGLSVPYFNIESWYLIFVNGVFDIIFPFPNSVNNSKKIGSNVLKISSCSTKDISISS